MEGLELCRTVEETMRIETKILKYKLFSVSVCDPSFSQKQKKIILCNCLSYIARMGETLLAGCVVNERNNEFFLTIKDTLAI